MKVTFTAPKCTVEVDAPDAKACFEELAGGLEIFTQTRCGACDSEHVIPVVRENQGVHFYEMKCLQCSAALAFGQRKSDGHLFPRRKTSDGVWLDNGGWTKWNPNREVEREPF